MEPHNGKGLHCCSWNKLNIFKKWWCLQNAYTTVLALAQTHFSWEPCPSFRKCWMFLADTLIFKPAEIYLEYRARPHDNTVPQLDWEMLRWRRERVRCSNGSPHCWASGEGHRCYQQMVMLLPNTSLASMPVFLPKLLRLCRRDFSKKVLVFKLCNLSIALVKIVTLPLHFQDHSMFVISWMLLSVKIPYVTEPYRLNIWYFD